jgi:hypothetical protein
MEEVETASAPEQMAADRHGPPVPPVRSGPGMRPALIVMGIAVFIVLLFGVTAAITGGAPTSSVHRGGALRVRGTTLLAIPAAPALGPIIEPGSPPANIVDSLTIPKTATVLTSTDNGDGASQYDKQMSFRVSASEQSVIAFYRSELTGSGWVLASDGPAYGQRAIEVLAKKGGADGWEWEAGAVISPTTFSGSTSRESTQFVLRLFQIPDAN